MISFRRKRTPRTDVAELLARALDHFATEPVRFQHLVAHRTEPDSTALAVQYRSQRDGLAEQLAEMTIERDGLRAQIGQGRPDPLAITVAIRHQGRTVRVETTTIGPDIPVILQTRTPEPFGPRLDVIVGRDYDAVQTAVQAFDSTDPAWLTRVPLDDNGNQETQG